MVHGSDLLQGNVHALSAKYVPPDKAFMCSNSGFWKNITSNGHGDV